MKRLAIVFFLLVAAVVAAAFLLDHVVTTGLRQTEFRDFGKWNAAYRGGIDADIIVNGSSRAYLNFSPRVIEEQTGCRVYNLGLDGHPFHSQNVLYRVYARNNKQAQLVIQTIGGGTLYRPIKIYSQNQFLPYLNDEEVRNLASGLDGFGWADLNLPSYRYLGEFTLASIGLAEYLGLREYGSDRYAGHASFNRSWNDEKATDLLKSFEIKEVGVDDKIKARFVEYLNGLNAAGVEVVLVYTPERFPDSMSTDEIVRNKETFRDIAAKTNVAFLDMDSDKRFESKDLFADPVHMNTKGAGLLSQIVSEWTKENTEVDCEGGT